MSESGSRATTSDATSSVTALRAKIAELEANAQRGNEENRMLRERSRAKIKLNPPEPFDRSANKLRGFLV